jgi:hypothetical protein
MEYYPSIKPYGVSYDDQKTIQSKLRHLLKVYLTCKSYLAKNKDQYNSMAWSRELYYSKLKLIYLRNHPRMKMGTL